MVTERDVIIGIQDGDIEKYSIIVRKYAPMIRRYIRSKLFNKDDADDLVQNAFVSFYKSIDRFDPDKPVKPYLFRIVINELKMYYRSYRKTETLRETSGTVEFNGYATDDSYLELLDEREREVFSMLSEGYKYGEIAAVLKTPLNTIKSIIRRARAKIRGEKNI